MDATADAEELFAFDSGSWQKGDIFYLLSDAIARWAFKRQEDYGDAAHYLSAMKSQEDIAHFSEVQRELMDEESRPLMRNDDVTLLRVVLT